MNEQIDFSKATKVYVGADNACRCGCKGNYSEPGSVAFKRAISKAKKLQESGTFESDICDVYANFSYGNNRAVCVYFD